MNMAIKFRRCAADYAIGVAAGGLHIQCGACECSGCKLCNLSALVARERVSLLHSVTLCDKLCQRMSLHWVSISNPSHPPSFQLKSFQHLSGNALELDIPLICSLSI